MEIDYKNLTDAEALDLISAGCHLWQLADKLREAGNENAYFVVDSYIDQHGYN